MDDFAAIARRMADLGLKRDQPFAEPLAPDWKVELNAKLQPKAPVVDDVQWDGGVEREPRLQPALGRVHVLWIAHRGAGQAVHPQYG